jgi:hypothetical protein
MEANKCFGIFIVILSMALSFSMPSLKLFYFDTAKLPAVETCTRRILNASAGLQKSTILE